MNTTTTHPTPNVPLPAGATTDGWNSVDPDGVFVRGLEWSTHDTENVGISIHGSQRATGEISRCISFYGVSEGKAITAVEARQLGAKLIEAADELDQLDGPHAVDSTTCRLCGGIGGHTQGC